MYLHSPTNNILTSFRIFSDGDPQPCESCYNSHVCWAADERTGLLSTASLARSLHRRYPPPGRRLKGHNTKVVRNKTLRCYKCRQSRERMTHSITVFSQWLAAVSYFDCAQRRACCSQVIAAGGAIAPWNHAPSTKYNVHALEIRVTIHSYILPFIKVLLFQLFVCFYHILFLKSSLHPTIRWDQLNPFFWGSKWSQSC